MQSKLKLLDNQISNLANKIRDFVAKNIDPAIKEATTLKTTSPESS